MNSRRYIVHFYGIVAAFALLLPGTLRAQFAIANGVTIPATDTLRIFIVFAEIDFTKGACPNNLGDEFVSSWPVINGKTQVPKNAADFLDAEILGSPRGYITGYYHEASFGKYVLLGDYYPDVISVPCSVVKASNPGLEMVLSILDTIHKDTTIYSKNGYTLQDFDQWTVTQQGLPKIKQPDGSIDLLYIIWKNNRFLSGYHTGNHSGYGINPFRGRKFKGMKGTNNVASYNSSNDDVHAYYVTIIEHLHGIFGGNHWHSGGNAGIHTFLTAPHNYGCTAQLGSTMLAVSAWDRWMMDWNNPDKKYLVSAYDTFKTEVNTETVSIETFPNGGIFYLRNHVTTGDAIRIKLPHINWEKEGDVKNQYLWLEYRTLQGNYDQYYHDYEECVDNNNGKYPVGTPGLYAYIQVGKDMKTGDQRIYGTKIQHPNALASWIMPFTAEGNYDFLYRYDKIHKGLPGCGSWGNPSIPIDLSGSLENPFTGFSDLFNTLDLNGDGNLYSGDTIQPGLSEMLGDSVWFNFHQSGDWMDPFTRLNGKTQINISTNPAPVPVYTLAVDLQGSRPYSSKDNMQSFENRKIWLNGLSIEILEEGIDFYGQPAMKVKIRWDDYRVKKNVRWCGDIVLSPNDFDTIQPSLVVEKGKRIQLDFSRSPTYPQGTYDNASGTWIMADTTVLTLLPGSVMELEPKAVLELSGGSRLEVMPGATLILNKKSRIICRKGASFTFSEGAHIIKDKKSKISWP